MLMLFAFKRASPVTFIAPKSEGIPGSLQVKEKLIAEEVPDLLSNVQMPNIPSI